MIYDEYQLDNHLSRLEKVLTDQLRQDSSTTTSITSTHDRSQQPSQLISPASTSILQQSRQLAVQKQEEQIQFLESLLKQQQEDNAMLESKLQQLHQNSQRILACNNLFMQQLADLYPIFNDIESAVDNDQ